MGSIPLIPLMAQQYTPDNLLDDANKAAAYRNALADRTTIQQNQAKNAIVLDQMRRQAEDERQTIAALQGMYRIPSTSAPLLAGSGPAPMSTFNALGAPGTASIGDLTRAHVAAVPGAGSYISPASLVTDPFGQSMPSAPAPAPAPGPAASGQSGQFEAAAPAAVAPRPRVPTIAELVQHGVPVTTAPALVEKMQAVAKGAYENDKLIAEADNTRATTQDTYTKVADAVRQQEAQMADAILHGANADGTLNPALMHWNLQHFASQDTVPNGPFTQAAMQIGAHLSGMDDAGAKAFLEGLTRTPKQLEAGAKASEAQTAASKYADERLDKDTSNLAARLGATTSQSDWGSELGNASPAAIARLNPPAAWSQAAAKTMLAKGSTAAEQVTAAETAKRDANTAANEKRARDQEQQNINLRVKAFNQSYGNPLEGASDQELATARMRAAGTLPLPTSRTKGYDRSVALAAAVDPSFAQFAGTRFDTIKNFKEKGDANEVVQLATALEHLDRAKANSAAMGTEPTLGLNMFPAQRRYHQDVYNLTDEVGKLIKSGVVPEAEGKRAIDNLMSAFQSNRDAGLDELSNLMGGKVAAKIQKYNAGTGQPLPASVFFDKPTQARLKAAGFTNGIDFGTGSTPAPAPAPGGAAPAARPSLDSIFNGKH